MVGEGGGVGVGKVRVWGSGDVFGGGVDVGGVVCEFGGGMGEGVICVEPVSLEERWIKSCISVRRDFLKEVRI